MKFIMNFETYEDVMKSLHQARSLASVLSCDAEDKNRANIFWIFLELTDKAVHLIESAEKQN